MSALVRSLVAEYAAKFNVDPSAIYGGGGCRRKAMPITLARRAIISKLWDRETRGYHGGAAQFRWDLSTIGRALNLNHTTVRSALISAGVYSLPSDEVTK